MSSPATDRTVSATTRAIRAGIHSDAAFGSVVPPIYLSTNYAFESLGTPGRYDYSRSGNPTRDLLGEAIATLEGGAGAVPVGTGMAAVTLVLDALVPVGGRVVVAHDCYGGTWRLLTWLAEKGRFGVDFVDLTDPGTARAALSTHADLVWIETPSNPLMRITDLRAVSGLGHDAGALVVADNTFCSPLLQHPLEHGADLVVHSTTKFINGHSDVVGGAVVASTPELFAELSGWANALGVTAGAFDSYLALRGLRTIAARVRVHQDNAQRIVEVLTAHPAVAAVHYPGLTTHPGHEIAARQQLGYGSLLSLDLAGGYEAARVFVSNLRLFDLAESLGGVESLVSHPATMTHASLTPEAQATAGIGPGLLRLSIGIEDGDDLVADIRSALDAVPLG